MPKIHTILMADVISSGEHSGRALSNHLKRLTAAANREFANGILSPLTVTLGDEFQGVLSSPRVGMELVLWIEHRLREKPLVEKQQICPYQLRFALHQGAIDTSLNFERAHAMLGPGLTRARKLLNERLRNTSRLRVELKDEAKSRRLRACFDVLDAIGRDFKPTDYPFIEALLRNHDIKKLERKFQRHRTSIERRRRTYKIDACQTLEALIRDLVTEP